MASVLVQPRRQPPEMQPVTRPVKRRPTQPPLATRRQPVTGPIPATRRR